MNLEIDQQLKVLNARVAKAFRREHSGTGLRSELFIKMVKISNAPGEAAALWPRMGTPLGIEEPIPARGVFPKADGQDRLDAAEA